MWPNPSIILGMSSHGYSAYFQPEIHGMSFLVSGASCAGPCRGLPCVCCFSMVSSSVSSSAWQELINRIGLPAFELVLALPEAMDGHGWPWPWWQRLNPIPVFVNGSWNRFWAAVTCWYQSPFLGSLWSARDSDARNGTYILWFKKSSFVIRIIRINQGLRFLKDLGLERMVSLSSHWKHSNSLLSTQKAQLKAWAFGQRGSLHMWPLNRGPLISDRCMCQCQLFLPNNVFFSKQNICFLSSKLMDEGRMKVTYLGVNPRFGAGPRYLGLSILVLSSTDCALQLRLKELEPKP